ncbi:anthranilate synthase component II [Helicobacter mustelae]|nr:aminodeoxychorismate/anthranilate synthase component II [Helicobacter mustelae]SQH71315.1 para-aminobenzoate synthase glutamine amidotransferase component II [Helicobacter mustelae]
MILLIDHYDSFTYNIVHYLKDFPLLVRHPQELDREEIHHYSHLILSPGPGHPKDCKVALEILECYHKSKKILGICLGHQIIAYYFGSKIAGLSAPMHGKISKISMHQGRLFTGIGEEFFVGRYHSLHVSDLKPPLRACAYSDDGILMALEHRDLPIFGLQFHPESILSDFGKEILRNFVMQ